jgi:hypothetical protein
MSKSGEASRPGILVVQIREGRCEPGKIEAAANQRITFQNLDDRDYRLRLRNDQDNTVVGACVFLGANVASEFIIDAGADLASPLVGHSASVEILPSLDPVESGGTPRVPGGGPRFELNVQFRTEEIE